MRMRFTGVESEDFPEPPIARRLEPGDEIEVDELIEHARPELIKPAAPKKASAEKEA